MTWDRKLRSTTRRDRDATSHEGPGPQPGRRLNVVDSLRSLRAQRALDQAPAAVPTGATRPANVARRVLHRTAAAVTNAWFQALDADSGRGVRRPMTLPRDVGARTQAVGAPTTAIRPTVATASTGAVVDGSRQTVSTKLPWREPALNELISKELPFTDQLNLRQVSRLFERTTSPLDRSPAVAKIHAGIDGLINDWVDGSGYDSDDEYESQFGDHRAPVVALEKLIEKAPDRVLYRPLNRLARAIPEIAPRRFDGPRHERGMPSGAFNAMAKWLPQAFTRLADRPLDLQTELLSLERLQVPFVQSLDHVGPPLDRDAAGQFVRAVDILSLRYSDLRAGPDAAGAVDLTGEMARLIAVRNRIAQELARN